MKNSRSKIPRTDTPADELLTVPNAGPYLGVGERMVRRLVDEHRIEVVKVGRHIRIRRSVLEKWIEQNTRPAAGK
jgi:excisionase family DNA binding protein